MNPYKPKQHGVELVIFFNKGFLSQMNTCQLTLNIDEMIATGWLGVLF